MEKINDILGYLNLGEIFSGASHSDLFLVSTVIMLVTLAIGVTGFLGVMISISHSNIKKFIISACMFFISIVMFVTTDMGSVNRDRIVKKEYPSDTKEFKLNNTKMRNVDHFYMTTNKGVSFNLETEDYLKMTSCENYKFQLVTYVSNFKLLANKVTTKEGRVLLEVVCQ